MKRSILLLCLFSLLIVFAENKIPAAFIDLQEGNAVNKGLVLTISDYFRTQLVNRGKYLIVSRESMEEILKEQQYQISGCTSQECLVQMGKVLGVRSMFVGTLGKVGSIFLLNIKLINVETGEIIDATSAEADSEEALLEKIRHMADELSGIETAPTPVTAPITVASKKATKGDAPKFKGYNFLIFTYGVGGGTMRLNFSNTNDEILKSHLGITGAFSEPFDNIEWRHLKADISIPLSLKIGGVFAFEGKKGYPGLTVEIFYQNMDIIAQEAPVYVNGYDVGTTVFVYDSYFSIGVLAVDVQIVYYYEMAKALSIYGGAGFGMTMNMWRSDHVLGYTSGSGSFESPISGYSTGLMVHLPLGIMAEIGQFNLMVEWGFWATLFTFTRNVEDEEDTADILVPLLKFGVGAKF
ncbi:hypothetical protein KAU32_10265 [bacterium]|nr:hypothetical protein [bacterium]